MFSCPAVFTENELQGQNLIDDASCNDNASRWDTKFPNNFDLLPLTLTYARESMGYEIPQEL